jgi:hypothetical protein
MRFGICLAALLVLLPLGCGKDKAKLAKVSGRVTLDSKPLAGVTVEFTPDQEPELRSQGETDNDGHYTLMCLGEKNKEGAVVGKHKVRIEKVDRGPGGIKHLTPEKYRGPNTELSFTVPDEGTDKADFDLKSK